MTDLLKDIPRPDDDQRVKDAASKVTEMQSKIKQLDAEILQARTTNRSTQTETDAEWYFEHGSMKTADPSIMDKIARLERERNLAEHALNLAHKNHAEVRRAVIAEIVRDHVNPRHEQIASQTVDAVLHATGVYAEYESFLSALSNDLSIPATSIPRRVDFSPLRGFKDKHSTLSHRFKELIKQGYIDNHDVSEVGGAAHVGDR